MRTEFFIKPNTNIILKKELLQTQNTNITNIISLNKLRIMNDINNTSIPEILFITSYPPRECGIATYSHDLINAIKDKFNNSFSIKVCALEGKEIKHAYPEEVKYIFDTSELDQYDILAHKINSNKNLAMVFIQHEFGLFSGEYGKNLLRLLSSINKPIITTFHTILPNPDVNRKKIVKSIISFSESVVVMTKHSANILENEYAIESEKISVIPHGTHLVSSINRYEKKVKYCLEKHLVFSTFGLLSSGKSIETALDALPDIIKKFPNAIYLIIGKTHPGVSKHEGEKYRDSLHEKVKKLNLQKNVRFINNYLSLKELLEYLQLTDIYLFTSKDPHQAVSGTFAYAMACGCPIISTPIPQAKELLEGAGLVFDFQNSKQLAEAAIKSLSNTDLIKEMSLNALHKIAPTVWQNSAISHIELIRKSSYKKFALKYKIPIISLEHIKRMTTNRGMIQFSAISNPDIKSGYTLDDNARALIAITKHYELTGDDSDLQLINTYLNYIIFSQQKNGNFLNYIDSDGNYFDKNSVENLEDANGRAIWALGEFISHGHLFENKFVNRAKLVLDRALKHTTEINSPRAIAFVIKGLYHYDKIINDITLKQMITSLADNLISKYRGVSDKKWMWFEEYLTYANSVLPEALLYAHLTTGSEVFKDIAKLSFDFLLSVTFKNEEIKVVSNKGWHIKNKVSNKFGEQPIDVAYTILALNIFYDVFKEKEYLDKMETAFNWFLGKNHLNRIIYNPCTGGCYDGLEENHINLNQGAESTVSYLLSRLTIEKYFNLSKEPKAEKKSTINKYEFA